MAATDNVVNSPGFGGFSKGWCAMRRRWMAAAAITFACVLGLSAWGGGDGAGTAGGDASAGGKLQVEVFSWWAGPGEGDGLQAMRELFEQQIPGQSFFDAAVAGGSG